MYGVTRKRVIPDFNFYIGINTYFTNLQFKKVIIDWIGMGRTSTNPVQRMYFVYNLNKNESTCQIINCPHPIRIGCHAENLETHVIYILH